MKKVLFVHPSNELYGADKVLLAVISSLPKDCAAEVWLPKDVTYQEDALRIELASRGVPVRFVDLPVLRRAYISPRGLLTLLPRFLRTAAELRSADFDLLYVNTSALALLAPVARFVGRPVIVHLHEYLSGYTKRVIQPFIWFASRILCVSKAVRDVLPFGARSQALVLYNGFDLSRKSDFKCGEKIIFVLASRWNTWKGHETLLEAWGNLRREDVELHVYGGPPEIGEAVDVRSMVARLPNRDSVQIHGQIGDIDVALARCHAVLVPSTNPDPLPTIAIEAAAAGRAVFASRSGGLPEIVEDGLTGWLVSPKSIAEWTQTLSDVSLDELLEAGVKARGRYELLFDKPRFTADVRSAIAPYL